MDLYNIIMKGDKHVVEKKMLIEASPAEVWNALTDPEKTKRYFFNCEVFSDWRVGSEIIFKGKMFLFKKIELKGKIIKVEPGQFLQYTLKNGKNNDRASTFSTVIIQLAHEGLGTIMYVTDDVGGGEGAKKRQRRSEREWDKVLKGLKELVEEEAKVII